MSVDRPAPTEIYTLSLHDALPICLPSRTQSPKTLRRPSGAEGGGGRVSRPMWGRSPSLTKREPIRSAPSPGRRSEEHTSELQSQSNLVCRLLLEKKKNKNERPDSN